MNIVVIGAGGIGGYFGGKIAKAGFNVTFVVRGKHLEAIKNNGLQGILAYTEEPLVSVDFNHDPHSCIVDGNQTRVSHKRLIKMLVWCDNEWGFANRMLDTAAHMAK